MRPSQRKPGELRVIRITRNYTCHAEGAVLIEFGATKVLCTASVLEKQPPHLRGTERGWVTAEYGMLPRATHTRGDREAARGKQTGRTQEIQRLIGRSLRAVVDLPKLGERQITVDCDVIQADGGTRTASITGAWVALSDCIAWMRARDMVSASVLKDQVAAVSCGIYRAAPVLDLDYAEDSEADTDANFVMTGSGGIVEVQGTAESTPLSGATNRYGPASAAIARRADPTPGSMTTRKMVPEGKYLYDAANSRAPPNVSCGAISWVISTNVRSGQISSATPFIVPA